MLERLQLVIECSKILVELVELLKIETCGCPKAASPNHARDHDRNIKSLRNLGFLNELAEFADHKQGPYQRDEEQQAETEKRKNCQRYRSHLFTDCLFATQLYINFYQFVFCQMILNYL